MNIFITHIKKNGMCFSAVRVLVKCVKTTFSVLQVIDKLKQHHVSVHGTFLSVNLWPVESYNF